MSFWIPWHFAIMKLFLHDGFMGNFLWKIKRLTQQVCAEPFHTSLNSNSFNKSRDRKSRTMLHLRRSVFDCYCQPNSMGDINKSSIKNKFIFSDERKKCQKLWFCGVKMIQLFSSISSPSGGIWKILRSGTTWTCSLRTGLYPIFGQKKL